MDAFAQAQKMVQLNNEWSAQQAAKQMEFQERMSNTAHQREIEDLKAAGLNPVLSAKLGGASTPSGAMGDTDTSGTSVLIDALLSSVHAAGSAASAANNLSEDIRDGMSGSALNLAKKGNSTETIRAVTANTALKNTENLLGWMGKSLQKSKNDTVKGIGSFMQSSANAVARAVAENVYKNGPTNSSSGYAYYLRKNGYEPEWKGIFGGLFRRK